MLNLSEMESAARLATRGKLTRWINSVRSQITGQDVFQATNAADAAHAVRSSADNVLILCAALRAAREELNDRKQPMSDSTREALKKVYFE